MRVRQKEDREALSALDVSAVHLPFLDSAYGTSYEIEDLSAALASHLDSLAPDSVLIPLGIFHADHVATHRAATRLIGARPHRRWIVYEDLPYRCVYPQVTESQKQRLQDEGFWLSELALPHDPSQRTKWRMIRRYKSQLKVMDSKSFRRAIHVEQYWEISLRDDDPPIQEPQRVSKI
jgi:LmbE family N-acetylglucosaminyl deacetylase